MYTQCQIIFMGGLNNFLRYAHTYTEGKKCEAWFILLASPMCSVTNLAKDEHVSDPMKSRVEDYSIGIRPYI